MDECGIPDRLRGFGEKVKEEEVEGHPTGNLGGAPASVPAFEPATVLRSNSRPRRPLHTVRDHSQVRRVETRAL